MSVGDEDLTIQELVGRTAVEVLKSISESLQLGTGVEPEVFAETAIAEGASVGGIPALLTTTMGGMRDVVAHIRRRDPDSRIRIIVGGAPVSLDFADEIGADGTNYGAGSAVELVKRLLGAA